MSSPNDAKNPGLVYQISIVIFLLALLPRMIGLGKFLTPDETLWIDNSKYFLSGILNRDFVCPPDLEMLGPRRGLECTLRRGHPGVVTMWTGSVGLVLFYLISDKKESLLEFVNSVSSDPVDKSVIPWVRLPTAVLAAAMVAMTFLMLRKILAKEGSRGFQVAVISALFMALSPFEIALSRVLHIDALTMIFITFSVLTAYHYWENGASRRWLLVSGICSGLSLASRTSAAILLPFTAMLGIWHLVKRRLGGEPIQSGMVLRLTVDGLAWLSVASLCIILAWPALWVIPGDVFSTVLIENFKYATTGHESGNLFLGTVSHDPGPLFYPVSWLLHTTPLVVLGLILGIAGWFLGDSIGNRGDHRRGKPTRWVERIVHAEPSSHLCIWSGIFLVVFGGMMMISKKKQDRYILAAYPFLSIMAAAGWVWFAEWLTRLWNGKGEGNSSRKRIFPMVVAAVVGLNGYLVGIHFPYYFTYYNPLFGGLKTAPYLITVGWGEGLDLAAQYLNQKSDAKELTVYSWYASTMASFFIGETRNMPKTKAEALAGDYVVFYIAQKQRYLPDEDFVRFIERNLEVETVIKFQDVPYVWIYRGIHLEHYLKNQRYRGMAELLGWNYTTPGIDTTHPVLKPGDRLDFDLWWENLGKAPGEAFFLRLVDTDGRIWAETTTRPKPEAGNPAQWIQGQMIAEYGSLLIPAGTPGGDYTIQIGFYTKAPAVVTGELLFELDPNPETVTIETTETETEHFGR